MDQSGWFRPSVSGVRVSLGAPNRHTFRVRLKVGHLALNQRTGVQLPDTDPQSPPTTTVTKHHVRGSLAVKRLTVTQENSGSNPLRETVIR